ncbi:hypothetical protein NEMBOFW57_002889 [Staphylotrichum longicolle]|uniref:Cytochrome P450 n=1 Tax=Staphylotrichum longicolle TaxID=669026 RepID=A0AAD4F4B5_9PEZI|nr:hypothetical protein NEMBOFW57_002889 [Staphylotrichum longicolle]
MTKLQDIVGSLVTYHLTTTLYNLLFHPLRHFPPLLQRASALPWALQHARGVSIFKTQALHDRLGPVVRIAPNHLSFTDPRAWRDIYGALPRNNRSDRSDRSSTTSTSSSAWPEMRKWRAFTSAPDGQADSIQGAAFHEHRPFRRALQRRRASRTGHCGSRSPCCSALRRMTDELLSRRLAMEKGRNDLLEGLISHREEWDIPFEKLAVNGFLLTFAGSETSATSLCGTTYLLLTHPETMVKLKQEIRTRFRSAGEIIMNATAQLPYLTAVINESLRILAFAEMRLILSRIVFDFDMRLGAGSDDWIER